jgi:uracil-DNA glycosylase family 4
VPGKFVDTNIISVILLSHPSIQEGKMGLPAVDQIGEYINPILFNEAKESERIAILHCIKCSPNFLRIPAEREYELCKHFVKKQLLEIKPLAILAFGAYPKRLTEEIVKIKNLLYKPTFSIADLRRRIFIGTFNSEYPVAIQITYDPYSTLVKEEIEAMKNDIRNFAKLHNELL